MFPTHFGISAPSLEALARLSMRLFKQPLYIRAWAPFFSLALCLNLSACGDPEENDEDDKSTTGSKEGSDNTKSNNDSSSSEESTDQPSESTGGEDTGSATTTESDTETATEAPVKPTLELSYRSIDQESVLVIWKTPSTYSPDKVRYLVSTADNISEAVTYAESAILRTTPDEPLDVSVALYDPAEGTTLTEKISIPADHGKDHPDFTMVSRPTLAQTTLGVQSMTLNLQMVNPLDLSKTTQAYATDTKAFHLYVDGRESTKAFSGQETLAPGRHALKGFHPGRNYNIHIQSSATPASEQVASEVSHFVMHKLPEEEFEVPVADQTLAISETTGASLPSFIKANDMSLAVYVDGKKLDDSCKVEIGAMYANQEVILPKLTPLIMGIKDSCFVDTAGAEHKVMFEASLKIEATGDTFITKSSNTNIIHRINK